MTETVKYYLDDLSVGMRATTTAIITEEMIIIHQVFKSCGSIADSYHSRLPYSCE